jgi:hypothetical protein
MKTYELSEELINAILRYLTLKPHGEVVNLIIAIQRELQALSGKE